MSRGDYRRLEEVTLKNVRWMFALAFGLLVATSACGGSDDSEGIGSADTAGDAPHLDGNGPGPRDVADGGAIADTPSPVDGLADAAASDGGAADATPDLSEEDDVGSRDSAGPDDTLRDVGPSDAVRDDIVDRDTTQVTDVAATDTVQPDRVGADTVREDTVPDDAGPDVNGTDDVFTPDIAVTDITGDDTTADVSDDVADGGTTWPASCDNGALDPDETDVDCGGPDCPPCDVESVCVDGADCALGACTSYGLCCTPNDCGTCGPAPLEVCDGHDDDCDGAVDDLAACDLCDGTLLMGEFSSSTPTGDLRVGWQWLVVRTHFDPPAVNAGMSVDDDGRRQGWIVVLGTSGVEQRTGLDFDTTNGPGVATNGFATFVASLREPAGEAAEARVVRTGTGSSLLLHGESDAAPGEYATPVAVGGGTVAYAYRDVTGALVVVEGPLSDPTPEAWTRTVVADEFDDGAQVAVTPDESVHVLWRDGGGTGALRHWRDGAEGDAPDATGVAVVDLAAGPDESLHAAWADTGDGALRYARWSGAAWGTVETVAATSATLSAVAVSPEGRVFAARLADETTVTIAERTASGWQDVATEVLATAPETLIRLELFATEGGVLWAGGVVSPTSGLPYFVTVRTCGGAADVCVPDCAGTDCGDDGCGGSCEACADDERCTGDGDCVPACTPQCTGRICGDNGCGATCGTCQDGFACVDGWCEPPDDVACGADPAATCQDRCEGFDPDATCYCGPDCEVFRDCCLDVATCCRR